jgi:hypothetical protein
MAIKAFLAAALLLVVAAVLPSGAPAGPTQETDIAQLIANAKTPADHLAIAAFYERRAAKARAAAENHRKMREAYRKMGGAVIEKWHLDHHCDSLIADYEKIARADDEMAEAHRKLAAE